MFIDADVLIAGSASTTCASHVILQLGELGLLDLVSSAQARSEVERNLTAKLPAALPAFRLIAQASCRWVADPPATDITSASGEAHPKDLPLLLAAALAGCQSLVTFNTRDYRPKRLTIQIETPGEFLARLRTHLGELA